MEEEIRISADSTAEDLAPIAMAVNDLLVIPVTMRSKNKKVCEWRKAKLSILTTPDPY